MENIPSPVKQDTISIDEIEYKKEKYLTQGSFGKIYLYKQESGTEEVIIKFLQKTDGEKEVDMLTRINDADPDNNNLLTSIKHYEKDEIMCIVFEKLDKDMFQYMMEKNSKPLELSETRSVAQQLLMALQALKSVGLVHYDIKPSNIMLVNHAVQPFRVKLIDFGSAKKISDLSEESIEKVKYLYYKAPEIVFNLPKDERLDMWSLGCCLISFYSGKDVYEVTNEEEYIEGVAKMTGSSSNYVLEEGSKTKEFFESNFPTPAQSDQDKQDLGDLLKQMVCPNSRSRITPEEALKHKFITMNQQNSAAMKPKRKGPPPTVKTNKTQLGRLKYNQEKYKN